MSIQSTGLRTAGKTKLLVAALMAAGAAFALSGTSAKADTTIYVDNFANGTPTSPVSISGLSPTDSPVDTSAKWTLYSANSDVSVDENGSAAAVSVATLTSANNTYAYLPITSTMESDYTQLTYTVTLTPTGETSGGSTGNWLSLGFGKAASGSSGANGELWALYQENGGTQFFTQGGTTNAAGGGASKTANSPDTITITLDTAASSTPLAYTITDSQNLFTGKAGTTGTLSSSVYGGIAGIFIGSNQGANGTFTSLTLSGSPTVVPEPAAFGLLGIGAVGLLLARRKRA